MTIENKLPRFLDIGGIELAPTKNEVTKMQYEDLTKSKVFNYYVKKGDVLVIADTIKKTLTKELLETLTNKELKEAYTVKDFKEYAKENNFEGYSKLSQDKIIALLKSE